MIDSLNMSIRNIILYNMKYLLYSWNHFYRIVRFLYEPEAECCGECGMMLTVQKPTLPSKPFSKRFISNDKLESLCSHRLYHDITLYNMKYLLSILGIISLGLFASCGGARKEVGTDGECCSSDHNHTDGNDPSKIYSCDLASSESKKAQIYLLSWFRILLLLSNKMI